MLSRAPNKLAGARSFQLGRASAPIAPQIVETKRGPNDGTEQTKELGELAQKATLAAVEPLKTGFAKTFG